MRSTRVTMVLKLFKVTIYSAHTYCHGQQNETDIVLQALISQYDSSLFFNLEPCKITFLIKKLYFIFDEYTNIVLYASSVKNILTDVYLFFRLDPFHVRVPYPVASSRVSTWKDWITFVVVRSTSGEVKAGESHVTQNVEPVVKRRAFHLLWYGHTGESK